MVLGMIEFDCCGTSKQKTCENDKYLWTLSKSQQSLLYITEIQCPCKLFCVIVLWLYEMYKYDVLL